MVKSTKFNEGIVLTDVSGDNVEEKQSFNCLPPIDVKLGVNNEVMYNLRSVARRCQQTLGVTNQEQINALILDYSREFRRYFSAADNANKEKVAKLRRFVEYCFELDYKLAEFFNAEWFRSRKPQEVIKAFSELIRASLVILTEKHAADRVILDMKISGIKGGNAEIWAEAHKIADRVFERTVLSKGGSSSELYAVMVLFRNCLHD